MKTKTKTKIKCDKCNYEFSAKGGNYKKHYSVCDGSYTPARKRENCEYCSLEFNELTSSERANHTRWCNENPKREQYIKDLKSRDNVQLMVDAKKATGKNNRYTKAKIEGTLIPVSPNKGKPGTFLGRKHTEESKQLMREKALASPHRRLRRGMAEYNGIMLDSSWELALAKRLDELEITWIRPEPIPWVDEEGITHNYFGDFYLPEHDLYLDPKNPQAIKVQKKKLDLLLDQYKNIMIIDSLEKCKNFCL